MRRRDVPQREPERLVHDRELGALITRANAAYRAGLDEAGAFQRLTERQEGSEPGWRWGSLTLGAVLSVAAGVVLVVHVLDDPSSRVAMSPEVSAERRAARADEALPSSESEVARQPEAPGRQEREQRREAPAASRPGPHDAEAVAQRLSAESAKPEASREGAAATALDERALTERARPGQRASEPEPSTPRTARPARPPRTTEAPTSDGGRERDGASDATAREPRATRAIDGTASDSAAERQDVGAVEPRGGDDSPAPEAEAAAPSSTSRTAEARRDCSEMLKKDAQAAEHCYARRAAESSGLSAEAALYELARVRRDVRRDPDGALAALNDYRARFPRGSLRNEVGLSRVEILSELGRSREALSESEALLGSAKGRERAAELYLLRGGIYRRDLADYGRAAQEYAQAEAFGGAVGAEATRLRGLSLEALGDVEGALAAYRRYLSGPEQPRKGEVSRRVEALTANPRGKAP